MIILPPSEQPSGSPSSLPSTSVVPSGNPSSSPTNPTAAPSDPPSDTPLLCADDDDFKWKNKKKFTCKWVAKKKTAKRCTLIHPPSGKPISFHCPATCEIPDCFSPEPTNSPTVSPTFQPSTRSQCDDREGFLYKGKPKKDCSWAFRAPNKRCKLSFIDSGFKMKVKDVCPSVCDLRCKCTNSKQVFRLQKTRTTCRQIKRKKDCKRRVYRKRIVADFCPRKCKDCYS